MCTYVRRPLLSDKNHSLPENKIKQNNIEIN